MIKCNSFLKAASFLLLNTALISSTQAMLQEEYKKQRQITLGSHDYDTIDNENKQYLCPTARAARDFYGTSQAGQISAEDLQDIMNELFGRTHPCRNSLVSSLWKTHAPLDKKAKYKHIKEEEGTLAALLNRYNRQDSDIKKQNVLYLHLNIIQDITNAILHQDYKTFNPIIEKGAKKQKNYALLQTHMTLLKENAHNLPFSNSPIFQDYLRWYEGNFQFFNGDSLEDRLRLNCAIRLSPKDIGIIFNREELYFTLKTADSKLIPQQKIKGLDQEVSHQVKKFIVGDIPSIAQDDEKLLLYAISTQLDCGNTLLNKSYVLDIRLTQPQANPLITKTIKDFWSSLKPAAYDEDAKRPSLEDIRSVVDKHEKSKNKMLADSNLEEDDLEEDWEIVELKQEEKQHTALLDSDQRKITDERITETNSRSDLSAPALEMVKSRQSSQSSRIEPLDTSMAQENKQIQHEKSPDQLEQSTTNDITSTAIAPPTPMLTTTTAITPPTPSLTIQTDQELGIRHFKNALELVKKRDLETAFVFFRWAAERGVVDLPADSTEVDVSDNTLASGNQSPSLPESDQNSHTSKSKKAKEMLSHLIPFGKKKK